MCKFEKKNKYVWWINNSIIVLCVPYLMSSVHEMDCLEKINCSCVWPFWCSVLCSVDQMWVWGVQRDFAISFAHSGWVQFLASGEGCTNDSLSSPDYTPLSPEVRFGWTPEPDSYWHAENGFNDGSVETVSTAPVAGRTSSAGEGSTASAGPFSP